MDTKNRFSVALSFAGENRKFVKGVSEHIGNSLGKDRVFYDENFKAELARPDLDTFLLNIYLEDSDLIVVFLCKDYANKEWCGLEWRAIREVLKKRRGEEIMLFKFDDVKMDGLLSIDGYFQIDNYEPNEIADFIIERLSINANNAKVNNRSSKKPDNWRQPSIEDELPRQAERIEKVVNRIDLTKEFDELLQLEQSYKAKKRHINKIYKLKAIILRTGVTILVLLVINYLVKKKEVSSELMVLVGLLAAVITTIILSEKKKEEKLETLRVNFQLKFVCPKCKERLYDNDWKYWKEKKGCDKRECDATWFSTKGLETTSHEKQSYRTTIVLGSVMVILILAAIPLIFKYDIIWYPDHKNHTTEFLAKVVKDGRTVYIDKDGNSKIPSNFIKGFGFSEGLAPVIPIEDKDSMWGYINARGVVVLKNIYDFAVPFSEGLAAVQKNKKWGFIDANGEVIIKFKYACVKSFSEGLAAVSSDLKKWGFIDKQGSEIIKSKYDYVGFFSDSLAFVKNDGLQGWIDTNENLILPCTCYRGGSFSKGIAKIQRYDKGKWGYMNKNGKQITDFIFENAGDFSQGLAAVQKDEKWGFIDTTGKVIIDFKYDDAFQFSNGLAVVKDGEKYGYINNNGKTVIENKYDNAQGFKRLIHPF